MEPQLLCGQYCTALLNMDFLSTTGVKAPRHYLFTVPGSSAAAVRHEVFKQNTNNSADLQENNLFSPLFAALQLKVFTSCHDSTVATRGQEVRLTAEA